jgi:hypothetical protein
VAKRNDSEVNSMRRRAFACVAVVGCILSLSIWYATPPTVTDSPRPAPKAQAQAIDFRRDILPILSNKCFTCHGPDNATRKGKLRFDQREHALKPGRSGSAAIIPGNADDSELVHRILAENDDERMPPIKSGKALTAREKELLQRWIADGAEYQMHWAFIKPARPKAPTVKNRRWVKNEIDAFILAKLEAVGLEPSPPADRITLIRRLSFDLRGLPPSVAEVDAFVADTSDDAYEQLVDRMLASPHFGEKMALQWLDLARYGDTSGYHMDSTRQMWLWRDGVIDAFNRNMPFDQFTIEQLAGDLLPHSANQQKIASGFNRNTRYNEEGGVDPEEYVIRYNIDRTNTLGQVWLGLTLGCAECHSHKYDPISHQEYYQLFAYFTGIKEPMLEGERAHGQPLPPLLKLPTPEQAKELAEHHKTLALVEKAISKDLGKFTYNDPYVGKGVPDIITDERAAISQIAWEIRARLDDKAAAELRDALKPAAAQRTEAQKKFLREYYLRKVHPPSREFIAIFEEEFEDLTKKIKQIEDDIPHTLISEEMATPRPAHVLIRGDFQQKGERVERGVPAILSPLPKDAPPNRLGLARWLVNPDHPLTARVSVNRLWAQMFGQGIVRTMGDFGTQGDYPSHPELLDWLACEFTAKPHAWDIKRLLRTIAMSATYQQSSVFRKDAAKLDPQNRLLTQASRHRLGAEELRDNALAIAGLLNRKVGGPSFMPYQPNDYYQFKNEHWPWTASTGDEQYRRGLYAFWRRTALHPLFVTFDAPSREECVVARPRTNTPMQALATLNDPTFVEAARVFAQKILTQGPQNHDARLVHAFRAATGRTPEDAELNVLRQRFQQQHARFTKDRDAAASFVNVGQYPRDARLDVVELASWTALGNLLLNLDEVQTRE